MTDPSNLDSPLREAQVDSIDFLLDEMNQNLIAGMPERITDDKLAKLVEIYRRQAENWVAADAEKRAAGPKRRKSTIDAIDIGSLFDET